MNHPAWYVLVVYSDEAWRDRVTVALDGRPVRSMTVERWRTRPAAKRPAPHAVILQAGSERVSPKTIVRVRRRDPGSRMVVIAPAGRERMLDALRRAGADDAFAEPADAAALAERVRRSLLYFDGPTTRAMHRDSVVTGAVASANLNSPISPNEEKTTPVDEGEWKQGDNAKRLRDIRARLRQAYLDSTLALVAAAEAKEKYARRHSINVSNFAEGIGRRMGLDEALIERIRTAAILHDVGKIGIPDSILTKPGRLTADEFEIIKQHPRIAMDILGHVSFLEAELPMILHHHERYDGTGYPDGLAGEHIPLGARIIAVADAVEVMLARRSYKNPYDAAHVRDELRAQAGRQFDPTIAAAAIEWMRAPRTARTLQTKSAPVDPVFGPVREAVDQLASFRNTV
jgi:HD-GYP domain-containing protein (c-di-GMP phosphodiesterase class II)